jgi:hypothetical protein
MTTTELFLIVLDSDRVGYEHCRKLADIQACFTESDYDQCQSGIWTLDQAQRFTLADNLKDYVERLVDNVVALIPDKRENETADCIAKTLVRCAFEDIDFCEVADHYLAKVAENGKAVTA